MIADMPALLVRNLRKAYKDVVAVDGLDLEVQTGECFGLLGPNGAGKTTTIEICEGLTPADSGEVEVLGMRWSSQANALRQRLGIQLQETQLSEKLTVLETIRLFRSFFEKGPTPAEAIALVQLEEKQHSRVGGLSGGQKQRLGARVRAGRRSGFVVPGRADNRSRSASTPSIVGSRRKVQARPDERSFSPRITWMKPSDFAIASPSWTTAKSSRWERRASS